MFTHFELRFNICHSDVQITLLRLRGWRRLRLRNRWNVDLATLYSVFKTRDTLVKPWKAHSLKYLLGLLIYFSLNMLVQNSILDGWLVNLINSFFGNLAEIYRDHLIIKIFYLYLNGSRACFAAAKVLDSSSSSMSWHLTIIGETVYVNMV